MSTLLERTRPQTRRPARPHAGPERDDVNSRGRIQPREPGRPRRSLVVALVLACACLMALDAQGGSTPVDPVRRAVGEIFGPVEGAATAALAPVLAGPRFLRTRSALRGDIDDLTAENARLRADARTADYNRNRLQEYDDLTAAAGQLGYAMVPARVVGIGPAQSFSRTVTIDAGSDSGLHPDQTVVNSDGLVGRVIRVTSTTATVLLVADADSVVGGRVGASMKVGFLHGQGSLSGKARLDLELVDQSVVPARGDTVVTWGSEGGAPYVSGIPVGRVASVYSSLRETTQRAEIVPFVDFGSLDVVGVVVPSGTTSDRAVIEADGTLR